MKIIFERDSVCAGDDVLAPNSKAVSFIEPPLLSELLGGGLVVDYLPCVSGTKTHWSAIIGGICVAKIGHTCYPDRALEIELLARDTAICAERIFFQANRQEPMP